MSKSQNRTRTKAIKAAVTPEEYVEINEKAAAAGLSAGGYLRACGLGRATPRTKRRTPVDSQILERAIAEMRRITPFPTNVASDNVPPITTTKIAHPKNWFCASGDCSQAQKLA